MFAIDFLHYDMDILDPCLLPSFCVLFKNRLKIKSDSGKPSNFRAYMHGKCLKEYYRPNAAYES